MASSWFVMASQYQGHEFLFDWHVFLLMSIVFAWPMVITVGLAIAVSWRGFAILVAWLRPRDRWRCRPKTRFYRRHHRAIAHELAECEWTWHPCCACLSRHANQGSGLTGAGVYDCGSGRRLRYCRFFQRSSAGSILGRLGCFLWGGDAAVATSVAATGSSAGCFRWLATGVTAGSQLAQKQPADDPGCGNAGEQQQHRRPIENTQVGPG